jgi:hypothetical protein
VNVLLNVKINDFIPSVRYLLLKDLNWGIKG